MATRSATELAQACGFEICYQPPVPRAVQTGYSSDLLSDALAHCPHGALLITIQNHLNALAVAWHCEASGLLFCHNREVSDELIQTARERGLVLLRTPLDQYHATLAVARALES